MGETDRSMLSWCWAACVFLWHSTDASTGRQAAGTGHVTFVWSVRLCQVMAGGLSHAELVLGWPSVAVDVHVGLHVGAKMLQLQEVCGSGLGLSRVLDMSSAPCIKPASAVICCSAFQDMCCTAPEPQVPMVPPSCNLYPCTDV